MQEHIRRAHPNHYIPKLPATEESFLMMVNTPLEQRAQLSPPEPPQPRRPHGQLDPSSVLFLSSRCSRRNIDGYVQMWRRNETSTLPMVLRPPLELWRNPTRPRPLQQLRWHNCITTDWPQTGTQIWFVSLRSFCGLLFCWTPSFFGGTDPHFPRKPILTPT